jgi:RimJ/RimL family protein N-acetyltransferase
MNGRVDPPPPAELVRTARLVLRAWAEDDLAAFFDCYRRWEVMRWLGPQPRRALADEAEARQRLSAWRVRHGVQTPPHGLWALVPIAAAVPVGTVLLLPLEDKGGRTDAVEIGWHLHPDWQGLGLATEAAAVLLARAARAGHHEVLALTDPDPSTDRHVPTRPPQEDQR